MWCTRGVSDARRSAAYRAHVIESAFPVHVVGLMLAIVAPVVSKVRNPDLMALFAETLPGVDFRGKYFPFNTFRQLIAHTRLTFILQSQRSGRLFRTCYFRRRSTHGTRT